MKKKNFLLLALFLAICSFSIAQDEEKDYRPKGEKSLQMGITCSILDPIRMFSEKPFHFSIDQVLEHRYSRYFALGIGAELYGTRMQATGQSQEYFMWGVPVFVNLRFNGNHNHTSFCSDIRIGYSNGLNNPRSKNEAYTFSMQGLYGSAGIGIINKRFSFTLGIKGGRYQKSATYGTTYSNWFFGPFMRFSRTIKLNE